MSSEDESSSRGMALRDVVLGAMMWAAASSNPASFRFLLEQEVIQKVVSGGWGEGSGDGRRRVWPQHAAACVGSLDMLTDILAAGFQVQLG